MIRDKSHRFRSWLNQNLMSQRDIITKNVLAKQEARKFGDLLMQIFQVRQNAHHGSVRIQWWVHPSQTIDADPFARVGV